MKTTRHIAITWLLSIILSGVVTPIGAQGHGMQIGLRGGTALHVGKTARPQLGYQGGLDLSYQGMWYISNDCYAGLRLGIGATIGQEKWKQQVEQEIDHQDVLGNPIHYTISGQVQCLSKRTEINVPLLLALRLQGFTLNIGPKLGVGVVNNVHQQVNDGHVKAYFVPYGVSVIDNSAIGTLPVGDACDTHIPTQLTAYVSAEIGYEWALHARYDRFGEKYIGLQVYVDYGIWTSNLTQSDIFSVSEVGYGADPIIHVAPLAQQNLGTKPLQLGIRLYYAFHNTDTRGHGWRRW